MKLNMHFHVVGRGKDINQVDENVYFNRDDNNLFFTRILYGLVEKDRLYLIWGNHNRKWKNPRGVKKICIITRKNENENPV